MEKQDQARNNRHQKALDLFRENNFSIVDSHHPDYLRAWYDTLIAKNIKQTKTYVSYDDRTFGEQCLWSDVLTQLGMDHYRNDYHTQKNIQSIVNMYYYIQQYIQKASTNTNEYYENIAVCDIVQAQKQRKKRKRTYPKQQRKALSITDRIQHIVTDTDTPKTEVEMVFHHKNLYRDRCNRQAQQCMQQEKCQKRTNQILRELGVDAHERDDIIRNRYQTIHQAKVDTDTWTNYRKKTTKVQQQLTRLLQDKKREKQIAQDTIDTLDHNQSLAHGGTDEEIYASSVMQIEKDQHHKHIANAQRREEKIYHVGKSLLESLQDPLKQRKYDRIFAKYISYLINTSGKGVYTTTQAMEMRNISTNQADYRKAKKIIKRYLKTIDDDQGQMTLDI